MLRRCLGSVSVRSRGLASLRCFASLDSFPRRHIGPNDNDIEVMLKEVGKDSLFDLTNNIVPPNIQDADLAEIWGNPAKGEMEVVQEMRELSEKNEVFRSFIGMGYHGTKTPLAILRNLLENPGWYTPYTPYQSEIAQGRMESLMNFQQVVMDLTGLEVSNASLLDEATAAGETVAMAINGDKKKRSSVFLDENLHPQSIAVAKARAEGMGIGIEVGDVNSCEFAKHSGVIIQYPNTFGEASDISAICKKASAVGAMTAVATDLMALTHLKAPGELGADVCFGNSQRFGVPFGFGGPHAAFLSTTHKYKRIMPGRIMGVTRDADSNLAFRMALQAREQHIKRERATSNICTAQALLANVAAMYCVYHGPKGLTAIARDIHTKTKVLAIGLEKAGHKVSKQYFDTVKVELKGMTAEDYMQACLKRRINVRKVNDSIVTIALDETVADQDLIDLLECGGSSNVNIDDLTREAEGLDVIGNLKRTSSYLTHPVFNQHHSETALMRYLFKLQSKDYGLNTGMIPLGSCTMKLNAVMEMVPITWPEFGNIHPFVPKNQAQGYLEMLKRLEHRLCQITGFDAVSFQSNSGAQGEYSGLRTIQAYQRSIGQGHRNICIIPLSAHGTNPASAAMCKMDIELVGCDDDGNIDLDELRRTIEKSSKDLCSIMITYPSTHGVFESAIREMCEMVHHYGGQVYLDGANLNAQAGLCKPGEYGADVMHMNLHKTFCIPHGGGGPGMGPIALKSHLMPFIPDHCVVPGVGGDSAYGQIASAPFGSPLILPITYAYIEAMGGAGITKASQAAILAANYIKARLAGAYKVLYTSASGLVAHELILDVRVFKKTAGIEAEDIAKRLIDYGLHAPTLSWPVSGTLMMEPTESEPKEELDRFVEAMLSIREEIRAIEEGRMSRDNNALKNAPHTAVRMAGPWPYPYSRAEACFPSERTRLSKFWPTVARIDQTYGERHFNCACPPLEAYLPKNL